LPKDLRSTVPDAAAIERILVVTAHPDDVDFGAAGTVATWTKSGYEVTYCIVTNGDAGGFDPAVPRSEIAGIRQAEQRAAAATVGVSDVRFLGYPDGRVVPSLELRRDISRVIREVRPQRVLTQSPQRNYERVYASHPDHLAVGEAALCAVYPDARNPFAHPELAEEGHEAWTVGETWLMAAPGAAQVVDVTELYETKLAALMCHASQLPGVPGELDQVLRQWMGANASAAGLPEGRLAEAFQMLNTA
jgi:LmbE family N-acetylglucosaminyl deacetylase